MSDPAIPGLWGGTLLLESTALTMTVPSSTWRKAALESPESAKTSLLYLGIIGASSHCLETAKTKQRCRKV